MFLIIWLVSIFLLSSYFFFDFSASLPTQTPSIIATTTRKTTTLHPSCKEGAEFYCATEERCIDIKLVCDFKMDCLGGSDEATCGKNQSNYLTKIYIKI